MYLNSFTQGSALRDNLLQLFQSDISALSFIKTHFSPCCYEDAALQFKCPEISRQATAAVGAVIWCVEAMQECCFCRALLCDMLAVRSVPITVSDRINSCY